MILANIILNILDEKNKKTRKPETTCIKNKQYKNILKMSNLTLINFIIEILELTNIDKKERDVCVEKFIDFYEINEGEFNINMDDTITFKKDTYSIEKINSESWNIKNGKKEYQILNYQLGKSIISMFSKIKTKDVISPELIMLICYYYLYTFNNR